MKFGDNLRNIRVQRGLTQKQLADSLGTSQSAVAMYESSRREPDFSTVQRFADFFGVSMASLLPLHDSMDQAVASSIAESFNQNPKLKELFDKAVFLNSSDLDTLINVAEALSRGRL